MSIFDNAEGNAMARERITPKTARNWAGRVLGMLSKRDRDDLTRLEVKMGQKGLIRYLVCQDHDPMFCKTPTERAFQRFAERVETAYHDLLGDLERAREEEKRLTHCL